MKRLSLFEITTFFVFGIHLFLFFVVVGFHFFEKKTPLKGKIVVHNLKPPPPIETSPQKTVPHTNLVNPKKTSPTKKKLPKAQAPQTSIAPSKKAAPPSLSEEEIALLFEKSPPSKQKTALQIPSLPSLKTPRIVVENQTEDFGAIMARFLETTLLLPETGQVKAHLSIDKEGHLFELNILESQSDLNRSFLETSLKKLSFPTEGKPLSLTITFKNE